METSQLSLAGGYRFIPGALQYSAGVAAEPGFCIERVRFLECLPLKQGFQRIKEILGEASRPLAAFCACELRSPAPFTEQGFIDFNNLYIGTLKEWGLFVGHLNPVARSNVCPAASPPLEPSLHAFSYTVPDTTATASFVVAGSAEAPEGKGHYRDHAIALGDTSPPAIRRKAQWVLDEMERRMTLLGFTWADTTASQLYTVHDIHPFIASEIVRRGAARHGLTWHFNRPPVVDLEYEMDCRGVRFERVCA
jgi:hypothetical protein